MTRGTQKGDGLRDLVRRQRIERMTHRALSAERCRDQKRQESKSHGKSSGIEQCEQLPDNLRAAVFNARRSSSHSARQSTPDRQADSGECDDTPGKDRGNNPDDDPDRMLDEGCRSGQFGERGFQPTQ